VRARASIHIEREPSVVFERLADFASHSSWRSEVVSTQLMGDIERGARVVQRVSLQGRGGVVELEITEFVPPERISFRARGAPRGRGGFRLEPEGGGTRVNISATVELEGSAALAEDRIREVAEAAARQSLGRLKAQLEIGGQTER
jgi:carbon monoxide dehydrogenase subunit G